MRYTVPVGPYLLGLYKGLYVAVFVVIVRRLGVAWSPAAWVGLEYIRGHLFGGLPWFFLGATQHEMLRLVQVADLGGIWLVSALVAFVNAAILSERRVYRGAAAASMVVAFAYGAIRLNTIEMRDGPTLAIVQPNIPQHLKALSTQAASQALENYRTHVALTLEAAKEKPALIIWPEAALYHGLRWHSGRGEWIKDLWYRRIVLPSEETGIPTLIGLLVTEVGAGPSVTFTNSALLVEPGAGIAKRFDKVHLVPFAEFIPMANTFPWMRDLVHKYSGLYLQDMRPGEGYPLWDLEGRRFGMQICFEAIFPEISREIARNGGAFSVNISNDGWFQDSAELDQMLAMSRIRAIENRIGFVRATNTGISAFIEPTGRVAARIEKEGRLKEVKGILVAPVRTTASGSLYRALGDWVPWIALAGVAGAILRRIFVDRKKRRA